MNPWHTRMTENPVSGRCSFCDHSTTHIVGCYWPFQPLEKEMLMEMAFQGWLLRKRPHDETLLQPLT